MKPFQENIEILNGRTLKCAQLVSVTGKSILDIGASLGWFEKYALENGCANIFAIDVDLVKLRLAKQRLKKANFIKGSALEIPFIDSSFDVVTLFDVIEHLPKGTEEKVLKEIKKVLKSDGILVVSTPNRSILSNILDPAWYFGHRHYSEMDLKRKLESAGFTVHLIEYGGGFYELIGMILFYIFKWIFGAEMPFKDWFDRQRNREYKQNHGFVSIFILSTPKGYQE